MAKYHLDRLRDKYGWKTAVATDNIRGAKYQKLIDEILTVNTGNINRATARISRDNYARYARGVSGKEKLFVLPDVSEALPKRSVYALKAAERGKLLTDTLRDRMTKDLRASITEGALRTTGKDAGTVNPKALADFEKRLMDTFSGYTKRDPRYGVPANIHQIAITELRTNVDGMKDEYNAALLKKNPDIQIMKKWRQNPRGVKVPRKTHTELSLRAPIPFAQNFEYVTEDGRRISTPHPHHESMPPGETIGCSCELEYRVKRIGK